MLHYFDSDCKSNDIVMPIWGGKGKKRFFHSCVTKWSVSLTKKWGFLSLLSKRFSPESWVSFLGNGKLVFTSDVMFAAGSPLSGFLTVAVGSSSCCCGCCCLFVCFCLSVSAWCLLLTFDQWLPLLPLCLNAGRPSSPQPFPVPRIRF